MLTGQIHSRSHKAKPAAPNSSKKGGYEYENHPNDHNRCNHTPVDGMPDKSNGKNLEENWG
jgi:hypothetical protein